RRRLRSGLRRVGRRAEAELREERVAGGRVLVRREEHRDGVAHGDERPRLDDEGVHDAVLVALDVDDRLLGLDGRHDVARGDLLPGLHGPALERRLVGVGGHAGQSQVGCHLSSSRSGQSARSAAATSAVLASAACSSTLEMLGDDSEPCTRVTGASSQSKYLRWISSASHPPYDVPAEPCSTTSTLLVLRIDSPSVSQSTLARSSQRRSTTSASTPASSAASTQRWTIDR